MRSLVVVVARRRRLDGEYTGGDHILGSAAAVNPDETKYAGWRGAPCWGAWESVAATVLFSVPALILLVLRADPESVGREGLDVVGWAVVGAGLGGALALTLAARGIAASRLLLSMGLTTSFGWILVDWAFLHKGLLMVTYRPLVVAALAVHFNLLPLALFDARRRSRELLADDAVRRTGRMIWGVAASAAALDLSPLVYLLPQGRARRVVAVTWLGASLVVGGTLAILIAAELGEHVRVREAGGPPGRPPGTECDSRRS